MNSPKYKASSSSWFWGIVLSLSIHGVLLLLVIFWGFGAPRYSGGPESIQGRLVSPSELEKPEPNVVPKRETVKPPPPVENKTPEDVKKVEAKKEEPQQVKQEKPKEKEEIKVSQPEKREPPKETKKVEVEKKEEAPVVKKEEPKKEETVVLNPKEEKKQVAEEEKPVESTETEKTESAEQESEPSFEDERGKILEEMKKKLVLKNIRESVESKGVEDNSSEEVEIARRENSLTGGSDRSGSGAASGVVARLFINRISEEIKSNWGIPPNIPMDGTLKAVVVFRINETGKVSNVQVEDMSGNSAFDEFCVHAIYKAAPLTPPPPELLEEAKTEGIEVSFTNDSN